MTSISFQRIKSQNYQIKLIQKHFTNNWKAKLPLLRSWHLSAIRKASEDFVCAGLATGLGAKSVFCDSDRFTFAIWRQVLAAGLLVVTFGSSAPRPLQLVSSKPARESLTAKWESQSYERAFVIAVGHSASPHLGGEEYVLAGILGSLRVVSESACHKERAEQSRHV